MLAQAHERENVIWALVIRDIKDRFGDSYFSWAWVLLEPGLHVVVWVIIFSCLRTKDTGGMPILLFILTGIAPFFFFSNCLKASTGSVQKTRALMNYQKVKFIDTIFATLLLEMTLSIIVFSVGLLVVAYFGYDFTFYHPLRMMGIFITLIGFAFGASMIISVISYYYIDLSKFIQPVMRFLYLTSGVFFSVSALPQAIQQYLLYNPLLQIIEFIRTTFTFKPSQFHLSYEYVFFISLALCFLGMALYFVSRHELITNSRAR